MNGISPAIFKALCSDKAAQMLLDAHLSQTPTLLTDPQFSDLGFDKSTFLQLIRDQRWSDRESIKFYAPGRAGPSSAIWDRAILPNGSLGLDHIQHLKASKVSIYVRRLELMHQGLRELAAELSKTGYFTTTLAAMYSPAGAESTPNHIDPCDVIAVQLSGSKTWMIDTRPRTRNAFPGQTEPRPDSFDFAAPETHITRVGDAMFIPRGFLHNAMATDQDSLHLVINLMPLTWFDVMTALLQKACDTDPELRASVYSRRDTPVPVIDTYIAEYFTSQLADPDALRTAAERVMLERARHYKLTTIGQVFTKPSDELL